MQQQDEEALRNTLQEVKQIKAELEKQKSGYEKEKKSNIPLAILSAISTGIACPLILWGIESFFTNHKWPLVIQIVNSNQSIPIVYFVISYTCIFIVVYWVIHRIMHPFECACGRKYLFFETFRKHIQKHALQEREQRDSLSRSQTRS